MQYISRLGRYKQDNYDNGLLYLHLKIYVVEVSEKGQQCCILH